MDRVCPLLGLQGDRRSVLDGVDSAHRCHADEPPLPLERQQQARVCLTEEHERCERYLAHAARAGIPATGTPATLFDGLVSTRMILAPEPVWRGMAGRARRARSGPLLAVGAAGVAAGLGGVALATGLLGGIPSFGTAAGTLASPTSSSVAMGTAMPLPTATPSTTPSSTPTTPPTPTPTPSPVPTVVPTAAPTAAPPPAQQTYIVQQGDTLAAIAQRFGTTVAAIQAANGIANPDEILLGQVLVIPTAE